MKTSFRSSTCGLLCFLRFPPGHGLFLGRRSLTEHPDKPAEVHIKHQRDTGFAASPRSSSRASLTAAFALGDSITSLIAGLRQLDIRKLQCCQSRKSMPTSMNRANTAATSAIVAAVPPEAFAPEPASRLSGSGSGTPPSAGAFIGFLIVMPPL